MDIKSGNSGGPVIKKDELIGIVCGLKVNNAKMINANHIKKILTK